MGGVYYKLIPSAVRAGRGEAAFINMVRIGVRKR
jgi:hypothetical protein